MSNKDQFHFGLLSLGRPTCNREAKSDVFTDLFGRPKYTFRLYQALHPEDTTATVDDIKIVTLDNVLTDRQYNDLGFRVGDRLIIFVEHQSTWTDNIAVRIFLYIAQSLNEYIQEQKLNLYSGKRVKLPKPEAYVVYTGDRADCPEVISLNETFWNGDKDYAIDVRVKIIRDGKKGDIINQHVVFTQVLNEQVKIYGKTLKALEETFRICKERDVLREYLESREKEILDIMITLFDHETIQDIYIHDVLTEREEQVRGELEAEFSKRESELKEKAAEKAEKAAEKSKIETAKTIAKNLLANLDFSLDAVAKYSELPLSVVEELAKSVRK